MDRIALLHRNYWIGILAVIIVCLLTMRYTPDAQLKDYVSFAATLASLILAILAIVQAMYSNSSLDNTIHSLKESSKEIGNNTNNLNEVICELQAKITNLPSEVENRVNNQLIEFSNKQVQPDVNIENEKEQTGFTQDNDEKYFENYVNFGSINGLLLLHAIRLSIETNKPFNIADLLPDDLRPSNSDNMTGYLVSHIAAGFVVSKPNYPAHPDYAFEHSLIKPNLIDKVIEGFLRNSENGELVRYFKRIKRRIDKFFKP